MTVDELKKQITERIEQATIDTETKRQALRTAEIELAFLQGQLHMLNQIQIEERPVYTSGVNGQANGAPAITAIPNDGGCAPDLSSN